MDKPNKIARQLRVSRIETYYGPPHWQAIEQGGDEDYDWDGDTWRYCGSLRGMGSSIQEALENLIDALNETTEQDIEYSWS